MQELLKFEKMTEYNSEQVREFMLAYRDVRLFSSKSPQNEHYLRNCLSRGKQVPEELRDQPFRSGLVNLEYALKRATFCAEKDSQSGVVVSDQLTKSE